MRLKSICLIFLGSLWAFAVKAQTQASKTQVVKAGHVFRVVKPDYRVSPYTGMTRRHWQDAAKYLLSGAFSYVNHLADPMKFPKQPGKSYPHSEGQIPTEKLEGLCRTLFMAAPLLREDSTLKLHGIPVAAYYRYQLAGLVDSVSQNYVKPRAVNGGPSQNLVEFGGLSLCLFAAPEVLWKPLNPEVKKRLARLMLSYGDGPTVGSNWKFFNILILSFFKKQGYPVNEKLLVEYLNKTLAHYRGDGWYNDAPAYDYYSMWAFQLYGPLWSEFFGKTYYPEYARHFQDNFRELKTTYPYVFGRKGEMPMWGRSISYRFGAVAPLTMMGLNTDPGVNYGWMRRIASGTLLQFLQNPALIKDSIPTLGFYGAFEPAVQPYSCRGSVFWMGKAFLGLLIPASSPFWTSQENEGAWSEEIAKLKVRQQFLDSSKILITNYAGIGASEIRAWCHVKAKGAREPFRSSENYNRLAYNSAFPWQADSVKGVIAMNYLFKTQNGDWEPLRLYTFRDYKNGVYRRNAVLETDTSTKIQLADLPLSNGILRVDRLYGKKPSQIKLGHYALPQLLAPIKVYKRILKGYPVQIIDNGKYQLAMVTLNGWKNMKVYHAQGIHPQALNSAVIDAEDIWVSDTDESRTYITLMLWKKSGLIWTEKELLPVRIIDVNNSLGNVNLKINGKSAQTIKFKQ